MRDERRNYVIVGAFVLAMGAALLVWLAVLSGRTGATDPYFILYRNVMGLSVGTQVLYEGYPLGLIEEISPAEAARGTESRFRVDVSLQRGWRIPEDSVASITASGLLSAVVIDIDAGTSDRTLEPGSAIRGVEAASVFSAVASVAGDFHDLTENNLKPLLESLSQGAPEIVENLEQFTADLAVTLERINQVMGPENADRIDRILANAESTSHNFDAVSADLRETREELDRLLRKANAIVEKNEPTIEHSIVDLHESLEAVVRHIDDITRNLEATTRNLNEFSRQIRQNPGVLIRGRSTDGDPTESP
jgi:phospholipid/cholesterol/gamma-HCH transport system substrate-binding protein